MTEPAHTQGFSYADTCGRQFGNSVDSHAETVFTYGMMIRAAVVQFRADRREMRTSDEAEAVAWALAEVGPNQTQVSLDAGTWQNFGVRHFVWENGEVRDTGWRIWKDREFLGGGELADLAAILEAVA